jgi:hypothetical protein
MGDLKKICVTAVEAEPQNVSRTFNYANFNVTFLKIFVTTLETCRRNWTCLARRMERGEFRLHLSYDQGTNSMS